MTTPTAERVVPGSVNLPPAPWPTSATTPAAFIDAPRVAADLIAALNAALAQADYDAAAELFLSDPVEKPGSGADGGSSGASAFWRDHLVLSWRLRTLKGRGKIQEFLEGQLGRDGKNGSIRFEVDSSSDFRRPAVAELRPLGGVTGVAFFVKVERDDGIAGRVGRGVIRMVEVEGGVWKVWTLFTTLEEVKGQEERRGERREKGVEHGEKEGRRNWAERRRDESQFVQSGPDVLVIGAGQGGLTAAARLKMLGIPTLVIDKNKAVGDNWRKRYHQLVLHDPVWYDHMPYLPFPDFWPVFTPKDKLADWFEAYVKALELNVWTQSEMLSCSWDGAEKSWAVQIKRTRTDGQAETRTLYPKHIVIATGHSGKPHLPTIPGMDSFKGDLLCHSGNFPGAKESGKGKRAVVVGACNSSMDICQDYVEKGYDVTMVQRSSTYVISSENAVKVALGVLYEENGPPVEDSDLFVWGWPSEALKSLQIDITTISVGRDKEMLDGLEKAGFKIDKGPSNGGLFLKYLQRGGGYYIDVGGAKLIIDGKIKVKQGQEITQVLPTGLKFADGSELQADEIVFATGYDNMRTTAKEILGDELPDKVGDIWGWDSEGEMRTIWTSSGHPGLWFHGGNLALCRYNSRLVALQILAKLKGFEA
ncbi:oxidoreductase-like protein [Corynascus novoguineensis]|uniref:Oxidoreductase-like protein n=1 Tax=Corynascus novoguineensis TaxID=1126955 RepID=A0AAN7HHB9_9PEZI|nr:oxidoreductase-like protein [Corynascus novoguineensis]